MTANPPVTPNLGLLRLDDGEGADLAATVNERLDSLDSKFGWQAWASGSRIMAGGVALDTSACTEVARYRQVGYTVDVRYFLSIPTGAHFNGGAGPFSLMLPAAAASNSINGGGEQELNVKLITAQGPQWWAGWAFIGAGLSRANIYLPISSARSDLEPMSNTAQGTAATIPSALVGGGYPLQDGNNLSIWGTYEASNYA